VFIDDKEISPQECGENAFVTIIFCDRSAENAGTLARFSRQPPQKSKLVRKAVPFLSISLFFYLIIINQPSEIEADYL
jgi:hypothetical protein